jgi:hypothetical protein
MPETKEEAAPGAEQPGMDVATDLDLHEFPSTIRAALAELHATRKKLPKLYDARKQAEEDLREAIRPNYSNDKQRDAAFRSMKESDPAWAEANAAEQHALDTVAALEGEVEELRGHFAVALLQTFSASGAASHPAMQPVEILLRVRAEGGEIVKQMKDGLDKS